MTREEIMEFHNIKIGSFYNWLRNGWIVKEDGKYVTKKVNAKNMPESEYRKRKPKVYKKFRPVKYSQTQLFNMIDKIRRQAGYAYLDDCYLLVSIYTDIFGVIYSRMSTEDELTYMFRRCVRYSKDPTIYKICISCKVEKGEDNFSTSVKTLDGFDIYCRDCRRQSWMLESRKRRAKCKEHQ